MIGVWILIASVMWAIGFALLLHSYRPAPKQIQVQRIHAAFVSFVGSAAALFISWRLL